MSAAECADCRHRCLRVAATTVTASCCRPVCSTSDCVRANRGGGEGCSCCGSGRAAAEQHLRRHCSRRSCAAEPMCSDCRFATAGRCASLADTDDGSLLPPPPPPPCGPTAPSCDGASATSDDASTSGESVASDSGFSSAASSCATAPSGGSSCCRQRRQSSSSCCCSCDSLPCCSSGGNGGAWHGDRRSPSGCAGACCHRRCCAVSCHRSTAAAAVVTEAARRRRCTSGCGECDGTDLDEVDEAELTVDDDGSDDGGDDDDCNDDDDDDHDEDIVDDFDGDVLAATGDCDRDALTARELRLLVKYTTGFSLRRFKCPPKDCPMCMQAFYTGSGLRASAALSPPLAGDAAKSLTSVERQRRQSPPPLLPQRRSDRHEPDGGGGSYYVDLSGTGVELSVSYPDERSYWRTHDQLQKLQQQLRLCSAMSELPPPHGTLSLLPPPSFTMPYERWNDVPQMCLVPPVELGSFVQSHPPARPWIPLAHPERNKPTAIFSAMCYNILCDKYCTRQLYGYSPSWALNWEYRKKGIMEEIRHYSADIISLQEVETEQFHSFFLPELEQCGYQGIFAAKSRARTMSENDKRYVDGCAIFWKRNKFQLYKEQKIEFSHLAIANAEGSEDMLNRVMTKDNIGLVAVLETKEGIYDSGVRPDVHVPKHLLVATVHVVWDPEFCDVKLIQTLMLMSELKNIIENLQLSLRPGGSGGGKGDCSSMPMIFCGDLNSLPDSGVIEFLNAGKVSARHLEFKKYGYDMVLKTFSHTKDNDYLTHAFRLKQAYDEALMPYTNYTYDFKGIIDYIFYSEDHLNPLGVLGPIESSWFKENKVVGCPHPHIASDHFSLLVEFEMPIQTGPQKGSGSGAASSGNGPARR